MRRTHLVMNFWLIVPIAAIVSLNPDTAYGTRIKSREGQPLIKCDIVPPVTKTSIPASRLTTNVNEHAIIRSFFTLQNPDTYLFPSHWGHPGYEKLGFVYDEAISALILKAAGYQDEAEKVLDYFSKRLRIPTEEIARNMDTNNVYGILKLFVSQQYSGKTVKAFVNAVDIENNTKAGRGHLEFYTTPGPNCFLIIAFLHINREKYLKDALVIGEALLSMQDSRGGIRDGDRDPDKVHTEPHIDTFGAFLMLYELTADTKWKEAADKAYKWFENNVYHPDKGTIDQGKWNEIVNDIFAEDCYSWTMAGPAGDRMSLDALKKLTSNMLFKGITKIKISLPDNTEKTIILTDFGDSRDARMIKVRNGFHPMGSVEWAGGQILALQKNSVRFWEAQDRKTAISYKAMAEILFTEAMKCFYYTEKLKGEITFYATGQGTEVGPYGSIKKGVISGWKTPYFNSFKDDKNPLVGGSLIGAWPLLPYFKVNPFILDDEYAKIYDRIPLAENDLTEAFSYLDSLASRKAYTEKKAVFIPDPAGQIAEPREFINEMWKNLELAYDYKKNGQRHNTKKYFRKAEFWAAKVVRDQNWMELAKRDNIKKQESFGAIIYYPWGRTYRNNDHPTHEAILRYPLLNEVATAVWGLATINMELGKRDEAMYWIKKLVYDYPLHQIAATKQKNLIEGYWNALISWHDNPNQSRRDKAMGKLYRSVLRNNQLPNVKPKVIAILLEDTENLHDTARN